MELLTSEMMLDEREPILVDNWESIPLSTNDASPVKDDTTAEGSTWE
jgi:hypothetical protein